MKANNIYVGSNGATIQLTVGKAIAAFPPRKGEDLSFFLMESGKVVRVKGARINGVGVPRFLKESGFELAETGNESAAKLADHLDIRDGIDLVEKASQEMARKLQVEFAGQERIFVPFNTDQPIRQVKVESREPGMGFRVSSTSIDLVNGLSIGTVRTEYQPDISFETDLALHNGWLVGTDVDVSALPRNTEYGGTTELAVFVICSVGLGRLVDGKKNLLMSEDVAEDALFPRGEMAIALENGDIVEIGIDAGDELHAIYRRGGEMIYSRTGINNVRLADFVGAIMAVIVRVHEMDAEPVKATRKKAA